jgi:exo-poly-alpha-galacturonosidase
MKRLALLVTALVSLSASAAAPAKRYVVTDAGAIADGQTLNTKAIQSAIDRCAGDGGGVIVVPKGTFLTGAIFFKQGVSLLVEKEGILKGTTDQADYPQVKTRWEGTEREWTSALVNFFDMTKVELTGEGTIDGSGEAWVARFPRGPRPPPTAGPTAGSPAPAPVAAPAPAPSPRPAGGVQRAGRPRLIAIQSCQQVHVAGLNLKNEASWGLFVLYSEDVVVDGLTIRAEHNIPSSDGIDIDSCNRVRIAHCDIDCNDDCISIKSGKDEDGLRVNRPAENIVVEQCRFAYGHGGVAMGSETSGGIRHVEVRDCVAEAGNFAPIRFKSQPSRGGVVEDIVYRNFRLNGARQAVEFNLAWRMVPPIAPPAKVLPVVRDVKIINVSGTVNSVGIIEGLTGSPILGVTFENCHITAQRGLRLNHVRKLDLTGLTIDVKEGEAITKLDAE